MVMTVGHQQLSAGMNGKGEESNKETDRLVSNSDCHLL